MSDDNSRTSQTLAPPPEPITSPTASAGPQATMRPPPKTYDTSFLDQDDSVFSQAVKIVAAAANDINREREERRAYEAGEHETKKTLQEQQQEILAAVQQADRNSSANYQLLAGEMRRLKESDVAQDQKISQLEKNTDRLSAVERAIVDLKREILDALPHIMQEALTPYISRIEALEHEASRLRDSAAG